MTIVSFNFLLARCEGTDRRALATTLLSIDLSKNWTNATVTINSNYKPSGVPNLNTGSLWYHKQEDLLYAGFAGVPSLFNSAPDPPQSLWSFKPDGSGSGTWNEVLNPSASAWTGFTRPVFGLQAYGSDSGWCLGGYSSIDRIQLIPGMVEFDMTSKSLTNLSASGYNVNGTIAQGAIHYVPSFGPNGMLVVMGGHTKNDVAGLVDFGIVSAYDPAKHEWFNQTTTGNKPAPREDFCTAGISSTNNTYEM